jgi:multidrug resistance efflux pump
MTPEDIAEIQRHEAEVDKAFRKLTAERDKARADLEATEAKLVEARAALDRVRELHRLTEWPEDTPTCRVCVDAYEDPADYPCRTIQALDGSGT